MRHLKSLSLCTLLGLLGAWQAQSQEIDYDEKRAAVLRKCDEPLYHGRVEEARNCYRPLLRAADPLVRAEASWASGDLRSANDLFREAVNAAPRDAKPRVRWGRMFLAAGQYNDAAKLFDEAMQIDKRDWGAMLAQTRMMAERFDGEVGEQLASILAEQPNQIEPHLVAASVAIERGDLEAASREAQKA
ncbi:MAG TPA: tetratricopeptide repeat protein, partial [Steroidobacteraceae bacterium]|nr:tetratricopeptide repeat protein [Steroidobacteraceae bacterium]